MTLQAIVTKYLSPTNTKAGRVKATASAGSVTVEWDHSLGIDANHAAVAHKLASKFEWGGDWFGGGMPEGNSNVYVYVCQPFFAREPAFTIATKH